MLIKVTKEHVALGKQKNTHLCPVARALSDALGSDCSVAGRYYRVCSWGEEVPLPDDVRDKIRAYDIGQGMEPFEFEV